MRKAYLFGVAPVLLSVMTMAVPAFATVDGETASAEGTASIAYPETKKLDLVEDHFGMKVADPYRWLEDDVRVNKDVAAWVAAQNKVSDAYLDTLPGRDALKAKMQKLYDYERFGIPRKAGKSYFFTKLNGRNLPGSAGSEMRASSIHALPNRRKVQPFNR